MSEARKTMKRLKEDHALYCERVLKIQTKEGTLEPFRLNSSQKKLQEVFEKQRAAGKPIRVIILKARQIGFSTVVQSEIFKQCTSRPNWNSRTIAHIEEATNNLHEMSKRFYEHMPEQIRFPDGSFINLKPTTKYSNRKELVFGELNSNIRVLTAGSEDAGRSGTIHALHCSEVAFWPRAEANMLSLLQALSDAPETFAVIESTANGVGGYFYELWQMAKRGESSWIPIFVAWWEHEEYQIPFTSDQERESFGKSLSEEELRLIDLYDLSLEQLSWRRTTIADKCGGDPDLFRQEYPSNDTEAFLVSGRPYFSRDSLDQARKSVSKGVKGRLELVQGTYRRTEDGVKVNRKTMVKFIPDEYGYLELWGFPRKFGAYCIGADVAEGLAHGDYSVGQVLDRDSGQQIAEWHGHIDPDLFGEELVKLAIYYNRAWVGPEINNHGLTTAKAIQRTGYTRLYQRHTAPDKMEQEATDKVGWRTDTATRPVMLDDLRRAIREGSFLISSEGLLDECTTFVIDSKGKPQAQVGCYDDRVMATAIALQIHAQCPVSRPVSDTERKSQRREREKLTRPVVSKTTGY